jgi:3-phenylpropionate/cinnamic acid dioxygenase small subunit
MTNTWLLSFGRLRTPRKDQKSVSFKSSSYLSATILNFDTSKAAKWVDQNRTPHFLSATCNTQLDQTTCEVVANFDPCSVVAALPLRQSMKSKRNYTNVNSERTLGAKLPSKHKKHIFSKTPIIRHLTYT